MYDVIIVGGGPVGLYLASLLEKEKKVLVLDKNPVFGRKADSGLYSTHLEEFVPLQKDWIEHEVTGAKLHGPDGTVIEVEKENTAAHVVDREKFTIWLASRLQCDIKLRHTVAGIEIGDDTVTVSTNQGTYEGRVLVGCDGASSVVRKHFGVRPEQLLNGVIGITKEKNHDTWVDLFFDKSLINDGFFWKIPRGETTEYGALGKNVNFKDMEAYFNLGEYEKRAAFMNLGYLKTHFPRTILVGEAAGQVKPWSLGGIIFGFTCSQIAARVITAAFEKNDFSEEFLKQYDDEWKKKIGRTIRMGMSFRELFERMDNKTMNEYFRKFKDLPFLDRMDMDFPSLELFG